MEKSLYKALEEYAEKGKSPFHMPGHKRRGFEYCPPLAAAASIDITEIDGFDDLHRPEGLILEVEKKAEKLYLSKRCFLSTNGSTGGILAAIRTAGIMGKSSGKNKIALARNCHKSVYNGVELCGLEPCYVMPSVIEGVGCYGSVSAEEVDRLLCSNKEVCGVVITSPTYEGVISDVEAIAEVVHRHGCLLIVDEAHGAHLPFLYRKEIKSAAMLGGDMVIHSLHKTLFALTQAGVVHVGAKSGVDEDLLAVQMSVFNTSSPSYPIMASIDYCFDGIMTDLERFDKLKNNIEEIRTRLKSLKRLECLEKREGIFEYDISKLVITTVKSDKDGYWLADTLRRKYGIECESANKNYVIAMTGEGSERGELYCLADALLEIDGTVGTAVDNGSVKTFAAFAPTVAISPNDATALKRCTVDFKDAQGLVAGEYLWLYPPGIPFAVPGEIISREMIDIISNYREKIISNRCPKDFDGKIVTICVSS